MCVTDRLSPTDGEKLMNTSYPTDILQLAAEALLQKSPTATIPCVPNVVEGHFLIWLYEICDRSAFALLGSSDPSCWRGQHL